jgi:peptidoglycan/LPS O-acetylase OafA/YrhL
MKLTRRETAVTMGALLLAALIWEVVALVFGNEASISELVWSIKTPLLPLAAGVLIGHFWFPKSKCVHCGRYPYRRD